MKKKIILQTHHIIYENKEKRVKAVTRKIRKGVHRIITLIRRYNYLTAQEIDTIHTECELKRNYNE